MRPNLWSWITISEHKLLAELTPAFLFRETKQRGGYHTQKEEGKMAEIKKVLMIDDDAGACHMVKEGLEATGGFAVTTTSDVHQALDLCHKEHPQVILLDNIMPGKKGSELIKDLKGDAEAKNVPVVMVSGKGEMVYLEKKHQFHWEPNNPMVKERGELPDSKNPEVLSQAFGVDDYISKPFSLEVLIQVVTDVLEKSQRRKKKEAEEEASDDSMAMGA